MRPRQSNRTPNNDTPPLQQFTPCSTRCFFFRCRVHPLLFQHPQCGGLQSSVMGCQRLADAVIREDERGIERKSNECCTARAAGEAEYQRSALGYCASDASEM